MTLNQAIVQAAVALMLLSRLALANDNADAVNERIPVAGAELEAHWQVDCSAALDSLRGQIQATHDPDCSVAPDTRRDIQLCAFIYQPPGGQARLDCPDYQQVLKFLQPARQPRSCAELQAKVLPLLACGSLPP
jgi:hypothetical protein